MGKESKNRMALLWDLYVTFFKLGCISFGGGYAMISLIEHEVVEQKQWMEKEKIVDVFAVAGSLPGAIALNSSAFVGYSIAGIPGAVVALLGNLTPSVLIVFTLSVLVSQAGNNPIVTKVFNGIRPAIIGLIAYAGVKIGKTAIVDYSTWVLMLGSFIAATIFKISVIPLIVLGAIAGIIILMMKERLGMNDEKQIKGKEGDASAS